MSSVSVIYKDNDMVVELAGLKNETTGLFINTATVTFSLYDSSGQLVTGQSFPAAMSYVNSSDGLYRATLEDGVGVVVGQKYTVQINVDAGNDLVGQWKLDAVCRTRK